MIIYGGDNGSGGFTDTGGTVNTPPVLIKFGDPSKNFTTESLITEKKINKQLDINMNFIFIAVIILFLIL